MEKHGFYHEKWWKNMGFTIKSDGLTMFNSLTIKIMSLIIKTAGLRMEIYWFHHENVLVNGGLCNADLSHVNGELNGNMNGKTSGILMGT